MNGLKSVPEVSDCLEGMNFNSHNAYAKFPSKCLAGMCTFLSHWQELTVGIKCYFSIRWLCCVIAEKKILLVYKYVLFSLIEKAKYVHFRTFWKCIKVQKLKKKSSIILLLEDSLYLPADSHIPGLLSINMCVYSHIQPHVPLSGFLQNWNHCIYCYANFWFKKCHENFVKS